MSRKIVCFGEVLWDQFEKLSLPGGAPMNVALNLKQLGLQSQMISKVGDDQPGKELLAYLKNSGINLDFVGIDKELPTGKVIVNDKDHQNVKYDIVAPVAWDKIEWSVDMQEAVDDADAFIFGSLAARDQISCRTLRKLLQTSTLKIFDINLRAPHYDMEEIEELLVHTDILKVNEEELEIIADHHEFSDELKIACEKLEEAYELKMICVTRGEKGAILYYEGDFYKHKGFKVTVKDTVGSGDAFLSGLVYSYVNDGQPEEMLAFACGMGAFIATHQGATTAYTIADVQKLIESKN
ncbi:MAG TPA: carbohydrate kinase [Anditalea sp.]|nr:carbohydrate kinase [Anditalea sp.]